MGLFDDIDGYCIGIILILLFFMYSDNMNSDYEGYGNIDTNVGFPLDDIGKVPQAMVPQAINNVEKQYDLVGLKPKKVKVDPPPSMKNSMNMFSDVYSPMDNYMLLSTNDNVGVNKIDSQIQTAYPRVGGDNNIGGVLDMPRPSSGGMSGPIGVGGTDGFPLSNSQPSQMAQPSQMGQPSQMARKANASKSLEVHMVYAPWCGYSIKALPDFEKIENEFDGKQIGSYQVSVMKHDSDTDEGKAMAKQHGVKGFPTHFMIKDGIKIPTKGRSYDELSSQINNLCA